jgi:hypothetical protein
MLAEIDTPLKLLIKTKPANKLRELKTPMWSPTI